MVLDGFAKFVLATILSLKLGRGEGGASKYVCWSVTLGGGGGASNMCVEVWGGGGVGGLQNMCAEV